MSDAYAAAGVDVPQADQAVAALVAVLKTIDTGRPRRALDLGAHYAAVLEVAPNLGIAVGTDGVGSKLIVAEVTGRYDTVGIDCVAMNVNDAVCVGAEPIAFVDYLAIDHPDAALVAELAKGLNEGARQSNMTIVGGETAVLPSLVKGFDLAGTVLGVGMVVPFVLTLAEFDHFWIANAMYLAFGLSAAVGAVVKLVAYRRGF